MKNTISVLLAIFLVSFLAVGMVSALPTVKQVKIDGDVFEIGDSLEVEKGNELDIRVKLAAESGNEEDIEITAEVLGYEYSDHEPIFARVHTFDLDGNDTAYKDFTITLPDKMDKDYYDLRITVGTRTESAFEGLYRLHLKGVRHALMIKDVVFNPEPSVESGRALLTTVRIKNIGEKDEESVKVKVSIPELGLSASDYIDEIEAGESETSEELYMRIPECVEAKDYKVKVTVEYDNGYEAVSTEKTITIRGDVCAVEEPVEKKTIITVGPETQAVAQGASVIYPLTITNAGNTARTYVVSVDGTGTWATVDVTPSNLVVLNAGESKAVYVSLTANDDATAGEHMFVLTVKSGDKTLKQATLKADVTGEEKPSGVLNLKRGLEIGVIILVVLLVVLGLIIGFNKLREREEESEEPEKGETYY